MPFYIRNSLTFMSSWILKTEFYVIYLYIISFRTINLEEYKRLLKMFDMTFPTPESINKYRNNDDKINKKFYMKRKSINKIKIYRKCLIKT